MDNWDIEGKFHDRLQAGELLAKKLKHILTDKHFNKNLIILALPRGGVPVAYPVAKKLSSKLDVLIVRKLGVPYHEELAMGAVASGNTVLLNEDIIRQLNLSKDQIDEVLQNEKQELIRREKKYRNNLPFPDLDGKNVILVDDGIATGATIGAAIKVVQKKNPAKLILAAPVCAYDTYQKLSLLVDECVFLLTPNNFYAVGFWYENFPQTSDQEVEKFLEAARHF